ncbi:signal recognition particle-docking protein FtsY [Verticiella sediminum]|uniref:Signal recognition particle receptor FtsY n=1 Tax=Verticiella sediminum TaxID=1247510 RepID=A0A556B0A4_9BURK|nr:signal recognition particle-docking protein FtsY [Verticiella sediminum]
MFKFFRKKQPPTPAPETKTPPAPPAVPDAGGWGRHVEQEPPKPAASELPPGEARVAPQTVEIPAAPPAQPPSGTPVSAPPPATQASASEPASTTPAPAVSAPSVAPAASTAGAASAPTPAPAAPPAALPPAAPPAADPPARASTEPPSFAPPAAPAPAAVPASPPAASAVPALPTAPTVRPTPTAPVTTPAPAATPTPVVGGKPRQRPGPPPTRAKFEASAPAVAAQEAATAAKTSWLTRLRSGLAKTGQSFTQLFVNVKVDEDLFEELETALIMSDAGVDAADKLLTALRARVRKERIEDGNRVKEVLRELLTEHLAPLERAFDLDRASPVVVMIAGVNGAGKTTSIGKLARHFQNEGKQVLLAAGDTFRAAAREQLVQWGERNSVAVIAQADGGDPAAVAFDAVHAGRARNMGVVMVDTAGRLPTQLHLMAELQKIRRVIAKADADAPHEVLLVVDGNTGQNALAQIKAFDDAIGLTGLVVTKLDGTAKGGILAAVASGANGVRPVPVYWIGVGEEVEDLQPFVAAEFAGALLGGSGNG